MLDSGLCLQVCTIRSQNSEMLVCSIRNDGTAGANLVSVIVPGKGLAAAANSSNPIVAYVNPLAISGSAPIETSFLGEGSIVLTGIGSLTSHSCAYT